MKDKCKNCGGWSGLHNGETNQCPVGGVENSIGRKQLWASTTYLEDDGLLERVMDLVEARGFDEVRIEALEAQIEALEAQIERLVAMIPSAGVRL